jgi:hypothetical protein
MGDKGGLMHEWRAKQYGDFISVQPKSVRQNPPIGLPSPFLQLRFRLVSSRLVFFYSSSSFFSPLLLDLQNYHHYF